MWPVELPESVSVFSPTLCVALFEISAYLKFDYVLYL